MKLNVMPENLKNNSEIWGGRSVYEKRQAFTAHRKTLQAYGASARFSAQVGPDVEEGWGYRTATP
jgi:hypothetical protein